MHDNPPPQLQQQPPLPVRVVVGSCLGPQYRDLADAAWAWSSGSGTLPLRCTCCTSCAMSVTKSATSCMGPRSSTLVTCMSDERREYAKRSGRTSMDSSRAMAARKPVGVAESSARVPHDQVHEAHEQLRVADGARHRLREHVCGEHGLGGELLVTRAGSCRRCRRRCSSARASSSRPPAPAPAPAPASAPAPAPASAPAPAPAPAPPACKRSRPWRPPRRAPPRAARTLPAAALRPPASRA